MIIDAAKAVPIETEIARRGIRLIGSGAERCVCWTPHTPRARFGSRPGRLGAPCSPRWPISS